MNWYSVFSVRSVMGVALVMAGLAHAADIKLSETTELQAGGDLTYTFASGDTFVVDAVFSPTSFKPICPGDFTMKVEGSGSVAATTTLDFSAVTGALTLSGLGTTESSLPKPTATASEPPAEEPASALVAENTATLTFAPVLLTAEAETVPTLTISEASATWSTGSWSSGSAPTSGEAVISATTDATLTIDAAVSLSSLTFEVADSKTLTIALGTGGSLAVTTTTVNGSGKVIAQGGTYGAVTIAAEATLLFAQDGMFSTIAAGGTVGLTTEGSLTLKYGSSTGASNSTKLLLRTGTFRKEGAGSVELQTYNYADAENQSIEVAGGKLTIFEQGGRGTTNIPAAKQPYNFFQNVTIDAGCTLASTAKWGTHIAVSEALRGEGDFTFSENTYSNDRQLRKCELLGTFDGFTGTLSCTGTALIFGADSTGDFGGSASVAFGSKNTLAVTFQVARTTPLLVAGNLTIGDGVPVDLSAGGGLSVGGNLSLGKGVAVDLSAGGNLSVGGTLTLGGNNVFTLSESAKAGDVLIALTGEDAQADAAIAEQIAVSTPGLFVAAQEANYVLSASPELSLSADGVWSTAEWTSGGSSLAEAPTSGGAKVMTTVDATLSIDEAVSLSSLELAPATNTTLTMAYTESETAALETGATAVTSGRVFAQRGSYGAVSVADDATLIFGNQATFGTLADGGTIGLSGSGTKEAAVSKTLLFRSGTFHKEGVGEFMLKLDATTGTLVDNITVVGGTLKLNQEVHLSRTYPSNILVSQDATFAHAATWASDVTFTGKLSGEGTVNLLNNTSGGSTRTITFSGDCADFVGLVKATGTHITLKPANNTFGGSLIVNPTGTKAPPMKVSFADGVVIAGDVEFSSSTTAVTVSLAGAPVKMKSLTLGCSVALSVPAASLVDGTVLFTLTGEAGASEETAALMGSPAEGYLVKAEGANYVLRKVTLPGVKPSEPEAGDEEDYSTEAAAALTAAAEEARIAEVSQVLLQTKGAASASEPTVTEVNNVLGCFEGVVEATAETQTLTIRYEFGVADIAADDSESPWNGKWQVTAKVEGPTGAAFAEGVTVAAYEVGEDGIITEDATPLATTTIEAGTPVDAVVLRGLVLDGLGTHGVRVRVKATK